MARWSGKTIATNNRSEEEMGRQVRSYVDGRGVRDHRTGVTADFNRTLDGELDEFMRAALAAPLDIDGATPD